MNILLYFIITIGVLFSALNFYLSVIADKENRASGIPLLGSLILFITLFFVDNGYSFYIIITFMLMDTGGIHWFIGVLLWEKFISKK